MHDRRTLRRRHLMFHLRVFDAGTGEHLGNLFDITPDGLMSNSERALRPGDRRALEMHLPVDILGAEHIAFTGTVAWSNDDICPGLYDTGFRDLEMAAAHRDRLETMIDEFGMRDAG